MLRTSPQFHPPDSVAADRLAIARRRTGFLGFTLLEVLVVVALMAVLSALVATAGRRAGQAGLVARTKSELAALSVALEEYQRVCGDYPQTNDGADLLQSLIGRRGPTGADVTIRAFFSAERFPTDGGLDPMVNRTAVLTDPWGRPYRYAYKSQVPWTNSGYILYSVGPDGRDSPVRLTGGFVDPLPVENADNINANSKAQ